MENALTPKRIKKLMYLAEDKSFDSLMYGAPEAPKTPAHLQLAPARAPVLYHANRSDTNCESSSGIIDLDRCEAFSEADNTSTAFNPGEMTGRSTGTADEPPVTTNKYMSMYSSDIDNIMKIMDQQTDEIHEVMRQSIASSYSFQSKRDLTADEASFVRREAPLPVDPKTIVNIKESVNEQDPIEMSVGSYFQHRCSNFSTLLPRADSPLYDVSINTTRESMLPPPPPPRLIQNQQTIDQSLDSIPVRQPRPAPARAAPPATPAILKKPRLDPLKQQVFGIAAHSLHALEETDETDSLSLSRIANLLGKESEVNVSDMLQQMRLRSSKAPLQAVDTNAQAVTSLKDSKRADTASSAGTVNTIINMTKAKESAKENALQVPVVTFTRASEAEWANERTPSAKSAKSHSTLSTVQENVTHNSFKSVGSPGCEKGKANSSNIVSPSAQYRELDKSVDWQELMRSRVRQGLTREKWTELTVKPVSGFVGVSTSATISITSLSESWLTAWLEFPPNAHVSVDLPRFPLLLTPGKTEHVTLQLTADAEVDGELPFTFYAKDSTIDSVIHESGAIEAKFTMPLVQAVSKEGMSKVTFPPTIEGKSISRVLILITECSADLQMDLSISEGGDTFAITAVQEVKKSEVTKQLLEVSPAEDGKVKKGKAVQQLCRLTSRSAIKVTLTFHAPVLSEPNVSAHAAVCGALSVRLLGVRAPLRRVALAAAVGAPALTVRAAPPALTREPQSVTVCNTGTARGAWRVFVKQYADGECPFTLSVGRVQAEPGAAASVQLAYDGPEDQAVHGTLVFEETTTGRRTELALRGGRERCPFPVKTSHTSLSWAGAGRRDLSVKNTSDQRVYLKCRVVGDGFFIDLPGCSGASNVQLPLAARESRRLPLVYRPPPAARAGRAALHLALDTHDTSRKVPLYGCAGAAALRWSGQVTYGPTALVRALRRRPVELRLVNRSPDAAAFVAAEVHFNLQYLSLAASSRLSWRRRVVAARGACSLTLSVDWTRVERRARDAQPGGVGLATVKLLTGAELTRRRILRVVRGADGRADAAALPAHLRSLADSYDGEDAALDALLVDFDEPMSALEELCSGLQELTAQVDLAPDFADESTIFIADDTVVEHHTIAE